jgi:SAM-dependent methyltransferase
MISHLASSLVERYASDAEHLLDPFCGSGAVLKAGSDRGLRVTGIDLNPFGVLLSRVKLQGFDVNKASGYLESLLKAAENGPELLVKWDKKDYWFTPATLRTYERIRFAARQMHLSRSKAGRAVLLALGLSVRPCSRADQRSPKPFISKYARSNRKGRHFDPGNTARLLLRELSALYGGRRRTPADVHQLNMATDCGSKVALPTVSHVITSPPYVNAQDYFRNSKLELYILEGVLPFKIEDIICNFIGTERGVDATVLRGKESENRRRLVPELAFLEKHRREQAVVVHRYLHDMASAFATVRSLMKPGGTLVVVCGDNLIGGRRIRTWHVLNRMLGGLGFKLFDSFGDRIRNRAVAPMRCGHKGLIKEEIVSAFRLH